MAEFVGVTERRVGRRLFFVRFASSIGSEIFMSRSLEWIASTICSFVADSSLMATRIFFANRASDGRFVSALKSFS